MGRGAALPGVRGERDEIVKLLAIDPGPEQSALLGYDVGLRRVLDKSILENAKALHDVRHLHSLYDWLVIEWITSYGMPVGAEVFDTCRWCGRFEEAWGGALALLSRRSVKHHLCGTARAKDANVRQALLDRFGPGREKAIGLKATPGPLYGIKSHLWSALAVAVTWAETR